MIRFDVKDIKTGEVFRKEFATPTDARRFRLRCKYSKKVKIINAYGFMNSDEERRVMY